MEKMNLKIIKELIENDELEEAIKKLSEAPQSKKLDELILIKSRLSELRRNERIGIIPISEKEISLNKIRLNLIEYANKINENNHFKFKPPTKPNWVVLFILLLTILSLFLIFNRENTIGIEGDNNDNNEIIIHK